MALARCALLICAVGLCAISSAPKTFVPPPILMYHRIDVASPGDTISRDLTISPQQLQGQLDYLKVRGIAAISMAELERRLRRHRALDHAVVLTFDDGYADQYHYAVPLLRTFRAERDVLHRYRPVGQATPLDVDAGQNDGPRRIRHRRARRAA